MSANILREWWSEFAACRGLEYDEPGLFFPVFVRGHVDAEAQARIDKAKRICAGCTVRLECSDYARRAHEVGIWGGKIRTLRTPSSPRVTTQGG